MLDLERFQLKAGVVLQARELGVASVRGAAINIGESAWMRIERRGVGRYDDLLVTRLPAQRGHSCIGNVLVEAAATYKLSVRERPTSNGRRHIAMALYWCFCCLTGYHQKPTL